VPFLSFGSLEEFKGLQVDRLAFPSLSSIVKDIGCSVLNLLRLSASPLSAFLTSSVIYRRVFPSCYKLGGSVGDDFLDGNIGVALSHKTYYWGVGALDLG
jgi:hypothetical protein